MIGEDTKGGLEIYPRIVPAGSISKIDARGRFIRVKKSDGPLSIIIRANALGNAEGLEYRVNMSKFEKWYSSIEFDEVIIDNTDADAVQQDVELMIGYGDYESEIISRSQAAQIITCVGSIQDDIVVDSTTGAVPVLLIAENSLRKRIKIRAMFRNAVVTGSVDAVALFITHNSEVATFDAVDAFPATPWVDPGDADFGTAVHNGHEVELESTAAIYVRAGLVRTGGCLVDFTSDAVFSYVEERYSN